MICIRLCQYRQNSQKTIVQVKRFGFPAFGCQIAQTPTTSSSQIVAQQIPELAVVHLHPVIQIELMRMSA
jgi:hypothetical protein